MRSYSTLLITLSLNFVICRDFYVGMFKKNDILVAQDRLYKERVPYRIQYAKYGRHFKCAITYFRVVDRLGCGKGPKVVITRGGLRYKYIVLRIQSMYNQPISVNIYVGCENRMRPTTTPRITKPTTKHTATSGGGAENATSAGGNETATSAGDVDSSNGTKDNSTGDATTEGGGGGNTEGGGEGSKKSLEVKLTPLRHSVEVTKDLAKTPITFECTDCQLAATDIKCNGADINAAVKAEIEDKTIQFSITGFDDAMACVYMGTFKGQENTEGVEVVAVIDNADETNVKVTKPTDTTTPPFKVECTCETVYEECDVKEVWANGVVQVLDTDYKVDKTKPEAPVIEIIKVAPGFKGAYQAKFTGKAATVDTPITKTLLEIGILLVQLHGFWSLDEKKCCRREVLINYTKQ